MGVLISQDTDNPLLDPLHIHKSLLDPKLHVRDWSIQRLPRIQSKERLKNGTEMQARSRTK